MTERDSKGRIKKGTSLNPSGRPKSAKLTQKDKDQLAHIVNDNIKDKNLLSEMLQFMLERAENTADVHKYLKEYAPFLTPKLASLKQEVIEEKVITFRIEGLETDLEMIDATPKNLERLQEEELMKEVEKEIHESRKDKEK